MIKNHNVVNYSNNNCFEVIYEDVLYTQTRPEQNNDKPRFRKKDLSVISVLQTYESHWTV